MGGYVGRDVLVEFAIASETASKSSLVYSTLGMMRGKELSVKWKEVDVTGDSSPGQTDQTLVTTKSIEFSGGGVSYDDAVYNQLAFEQHVMHPPASTGNQPKVWLRITYPNKVYEGPFIVPEFTNSGDIGTEATWTISAKSNGDVTLIPA